MARILLVEDEDPLCKLIAKWLKDELHTVSVCSDGNYAVGLLSHEHFDVIVLDLMLPGIDGIEVCRRFRSSGGVTPIIILTAKRGLNAKENGLDSGADDYLTKPFKLRELSARIRALLRRQPNLVPSLIKAGGLEIDTATGQVFFKQQEIKLVPKEFSLLEVLIKNADKVVKSESLITQVWGDETNVSQETVRSYIRLLRQKFDKSLSLIETVHGVGYKLNTKNVQ